MKWLLTGMFWRKLVGVDVVGEEKEGWPKNVQRNAEDKYRIGNYVSRSCVPRMHEIRLLDSLLPVSICNADLCTSQRPGLGAL